MVLDQELELVLLAVGIDLSLGQRDHPLIYFYCSLLDTDTSSHFPEY